MRTSANRQNCTANSSFAKKLDALLKLRNGNKGPSSSGRVSKRKVPPKGKSYQPTKTAAPNKLPSSTRTVPKFRALDEPKAPLPYQRPWEAQVRSLQQVRETLRPTPREVPSIVPAPPKCPLKSKIPQKIRPVARVLQPYKQCERQPSKQLVPMAQPETQLTLPDQDEQATTQPSVALLEHLVPQSPITLDQRHLPQSAIGPFPFDHGERLGQPAWFDIPHYPPIGDAFIAYLVSRII